MDMNLILKQLYMAYKLQNMKELVFNNLSLTNTGEQSVH